MINEKQYAENFAQRVQTEIRNAYDDNFSSIEPTPSSGSVPSADNIENDNVEIPAPPEAILLTEASCGGCAWAKEKLAPDIEQGKIKVCDLNNEECKAIGREINLKEVPAIVVEDEQGKLVQCDMGKEEGSDNLVIQCPVMPNTKEPEEAPKRPPKHGKIGIACMDFRIKNSLMTDAKNAGLSQEDIMKIYSLPECEDQPLGFAELKRGGKGTETRAINPRTKFMKRCLSGSTGESQPERMRNCSKAWCEMPDEEKKKFE